MTAHPVEDQFAQVPRSPQAPADREAPWTVWARFLIKADSEHEARAITDSVLAQMEAQADGEPELVPFPRRPGTWMATAQMDLTVLPSLKPDDARTRLSYVSSGLGQVTWTSRVSEREGRWDWPPDIWSKEPGKDDLLVHPAVLAVTLWASAEDSK
ncbi:MAG TPA: hypothetical protein VGM53_30760 [Streptosporangiaceae bacterium]